MKFLEFLTDKVAMFLAVGVGIFTVTLMFITVTPDLPSKVIMGLLGASIVLFSVRALVKRKRLLWWLTAVIIVFSDVSLLLSLTETQSHAAITEDPARTRLQGATDDATTRLGELLSQQAEAKTRATLDALAAQIQTASDDLRRARAEESAYRPEAHASVTARDLFMAIPTAMMSGSLGRWMTLLFAFIVACVLQLTIVATVTATVKSMRRSEVAGKRKGSGKGKRPRRTITTPAPDTVVDIAVAETGEG